MQIEFSPDLKAAVDHLRQAAEAAGQRVAGSPVAHHLRQAARHALEAGIAGLDELERRAAAKPSKPTATDGDSGDSGRPT